VFFTLYFQKAVRMHFGKYAFYGLKIDFIIGWNLTAIVMLKSYFG